MSEIAKSLDRPPSYPTKFFGCELGAQTTIDHKTDKYIVNGSHTHDKLQDMLDGFIQKFVLCPKCENPETTLTVHKNTISQRCMACGDRGVLKVAHRLTQYITKNPPNASSQSSPVENGAGKKDKKSKGKKGKRDSDSEEEKAQDINGVHAQYQDADRDGEGDSPPPVIDDQEDEEWAEDHDAAALDNDEGISEQLSSVTVTSDLDKSSNTRLEMFFSFVENKKRGGDVVSLNKELLAEAERLDIVDKAVYVLTELLFSVNIVQEINKYRIIFLRFCHNNQRSQKNLLAAVEMLIGQNSEVLIPKTAHILKTLYDTDILDEEIIIDWQDKSSKKRLGKELAAALHAKAAPFIKWLKEAEEESDSEESEEEGPEVDIGFSHQAATGLKETKVKEPSAKKDEEDDFDIDDI